MTYAITYPRATAPVAPQKKQDGYACRRIFSNDQLIERFDKWLLICGLSPHTRTSYLHVTKQFGKFLVDKPITSATRENVRDYLGRLYARNLAPATLSTHHFALRAFFHFLQLGGQVRVSPADQIQTRRVPKRLPRAKSEEEIASILDQADTWRDLAILELLYASGLRVSELAHLRVEELNLKGSSLMVLRGKGGKDRPAFFGRKAARALKTYLGGRRTGSVFGLGARRIARIVKQAAERAGVSDVSPHIFRHSFATHLLNRGMDIRFVQELLGHSSLTTTQKYLAVATADLQRTHAKFHPRG